MTKSLNEVRQGGKNPRPGSRAHSRNYIRSTAKRLRDGKVADQPVLIPTKQADESVNEDFKVGDKVRIKNTHPMKGYRGLTGELVYHFGQGHFNMSTGRIGGKKSTLGGVNRMVTDKHIEKISEEIMPPEEILIESPKDPMQGVWGDKLANVDWHQQNRIAEEWSVGDKVTIHAPEHPRFHGTTGKIKNVYDTHVDLHMDKPVTKNRVTGRNDYRLHGVAKEQLIKEEDVSIAQPGVATKHIEKISEEIMPPEEIHVLTEAKDPPMMLILRRQAIRNFPNDKRVALYANPNLGIQVAVPYDHATGRLEKSNFLPLKEWQEVGHIGEEWSYGDPVNLSPDGRDDDDQRPDGQQAAVRDARKAVSGDVHAADNDDRISHQHYTPAVAEAVKHHGHAPGTISAKALTAMAHRQNPINRHRRMKKRTQRRHGWVQVHENMNESYDFTGQPHLKGVNPNKIERHEWAHAAGWYDARHSYEPEPSTFHTYREHYMKGYNAMRKSVGMKPMKEDEAFEDLSKQQCIDVLNAVYQALVDKPERDELSAAVFNWLTDEIEEHGDFESMPDDVVEDVFDDMMSLFAGAMDASHAEGGSTVAVARMRNMNFPTMEGANRDAEECAYEVEADGEDDHEGPGAARDAEMHFPDQKRKDALVPMPSTAIAQKANMNFPKQVELDPPENFMTSNPPYNYWWENLGEAHHKARVIRDFADWHDQANRRGDAAFKIHNNGDSTSAFRNGKYIGTYHHNKKHGTLKEETLNETPFMRIQGLMRRGEPAKVKFLNGDEATVHHKTGEILNALFTRLTPGSAHLHKLSKMINSSHAGMKKVHAFAKSALGKG